MPVTLNDLTVSYKLLNNHEGAGPYTGEITNGRRQDQLVFQIAFADLEAFLEQVIGKRRYYGSVSSGTIESQDPLQHPFNPHLYAYSISYEAVGQDATVSITKPWTHMNVRITFAALSWEFDDPSQPYMSRRIRGSASAITIPGWQQKFSTNNERVEADVARLVGQKTIEIVRYNVPDLNAFEEVADALMSTVNSAALTIRKRIYTAGTILFLTYSADEDNQGLGQTKYTVSMQFAYRVIPWNSGVRSDGTVDTYYISPYPVGNLSVLLS